MRGPDEFPKYQEERLEPRAQIQIREPETKEEIDPIRPPRKGEFAVRKTWLRVLATLALTALGGVTILWFVTPKVIQPIVGISPDITWGEGAYNALFGALTLVGTAVWAVLSWFVFAPILAYFGPEIYTTPPNTGVVTLWLGFKAQSHGPGLFLVFTPFEKPEKVVSRKLLGAYVPDTETSDKDGWGMYINAVLFFRIVDPVAAAYAAEDLREPLGRLIETTLFPYVSAREFEYLRSHKTEVSEELKVVIDDELERMRSEAEVDLGIAVVRFSFTDAVIRDREQARDYVRAAAETKMAKGTRALAEADADYLDQLAERIQSKDPKNISWGEAYELAAETRLATAIERSQGTGAIVSTGARRTRDRRPAGEDELESKSDEE